MEYVTIPPISVSSLKSDKNVNQIKLTNTTDARKATKHNTLSASSERRFKAKQKIEALLHISNVLMEHHLITSIELPLKKLTLYISATLCNKLKVIAAMMI